MTDQSFNDFYKELPLPIQVKISGLKKWKDQQRCLLGNILLIRGLQSLGLPEYSLHHLKYTEFQRPYFNDTIDFNISHSGNYILCAISKFHKIGIDIEEIKEIPTLVLENEFSDSERLETAKAKNRLRAFYKIWTQKEAFLKAIGRGLNNRLRDITIRNNKIVWENIEWNFYEVILDERYVSFLSVNSTCSHIIIEEARLNKIDKDARY